MSANIAADAKIPAPLATDAATASTAAGQCHLCRRGILRGERYGRLVPSERLAHVICVASQAGTDTRRAA
jgi:hypothetical protein